MKIRAVLITLIVVLVPAAVCAEGTRAADEKAIRDVEATWEAAWNRHDVAAMAATYATDSDAINLAGEWFQSRAAFQKSLKELHSGKTKGTIWQTEQTRIKFLTPEIAVVHVYANSHGDRNPDGSLMAPRRVILMRVEVKREGKWLIVASQATNIVPRATAGITDDANQSAGQ
jgi:uncharacterized protein (TIGR02246 family)